MKSKFGVLIRLIVLMGFLFSLTGGIAKKVQAATCAWEGDNGVDWAVPENWSCGHVPTTSDDVTIPDVVVNPIINAHTTGVDVNSISIASGGVLTINATQNSLIIYTSSSFTNNGEIVINGVNDGSCGLGINSPGFANNGIVTINTGYLSLVRGGTHTGNFVGEPGTALSFSNQWPDQTWNFTADSLIQIPIIILNGSGSTTMNIEGEFSPGMVLDNDGYLSIMSSATINLNTNDVFMPPKVSAYGTLNLPDNKLDIQDLVVGGGGQLHNTHTLNIIHSLELKGGTLSGAGDVIVPITASSFSIRGGTISDKELSNNATANWKTGNLTLSNSAVFVNNGTFNANATTTMTGSVTADFVNNGTFIKNTTDTTTTMNVPFTNNGSIEVNAGELIFQQGIQNGTNVEIDLGGGTLDPGDTLTLAEGDNLIGSGVLSSSLVNGGLVSPGESPGTITVNVDYTQEATGTLEIELGGTESETQYDQLIVTGAAALDGTLNISLIDEFSPRLGDSFTILTYGEHTGSFNSVNLPTLVPGLDWNTQYGDNSMVLEVLQTGGSVSGIVTYIGDLPGTTPIEVNAHLTLESEPIAQSEDITSGETYFIGGLEDGYYYISALIDSGNDGGPPSPNDPFAWYDKDGDGTPDQVQVQSTAPTTDIDFILDDPNLIFLPLILR